MNDYPRMLYRAGGKEPIHGLGLFSTRIVSDAAEHEAAMAEGWRETTTEALAPAPEPAEDNAPPTRAELEKMAEELGIKIDGRWSDKRLAEAIAAKA